MTDQQEPAMVGEAVKRTDERIETARQKGYGVDLYT
jgi:hypothetical protein